MARRGRRKKGFNPHAWKRRFRTRKGGSGRKLDWMIEHGRDRRKQRQTAAQVASRIKKEEKRQGYRKHWGEFDDMPPLRGRNDEARRQARNKRYSVFRGLSGKAVKAFKEGVRNEKNRQGSKSIRDKLWTGFCEICSISLSVPREPQRQPWHMGTLEHLLDFDLGGKARVWAGEVSVLCRACNVTLGDMKMSLHNDTVEMSQTKRSMAVYDFFIFKHVLHVSLDAAARDFNREYLQFWDIRRKKANHCHRKALRTHPASLVETIQPTVYWDDCVETGEVIGHRHCSKCGACYTNSSTHLNGHDLPYLRDIDND